MEEQENKSLRAAPQAQQDEAPAPLPQEQEEQKASFQDLIRGEYREAYLQQAAALLRAQAEQTDRYLAYRELQHRGELIHEKHPEFDLLRELEDPGFARLVENGVDPETAWEVVRRQGAPRPELEDRPRENGLGRTLAPAVFQSDPRQLTREERAQLRRRAARGEQIVW